VVLYVSLEGNRIEVHQHLIIIILTLPSTKIHEEPFLPISPSQYETWARRWARPVRSPLQTVPITPTERSKLMSLLRMGGTIAVILRAELFLFDAFDQLLQIEKSADGDDDKKQHVGDNEHTDQNVGGDSHGTHEGVLRPSSSSS